MTTREATGLLPRIGDTLIIGGDGRALGEPPKGSKLVVTVPPGRHTFYKALYADAGAGDYRIFGPEICHLAEGELQAGKIYAVEASVYRLFAIAPSDGRLTEWADLPSSRMTAAGSVTSDPNWGPCRQFARRNADKDREQKSTLSAIHALDRWP